MFKVNPEQPSIMDEAPIRVQKKSLNSGTKRIHKFGGVITRETGGSE